MTPHEFRAASPIFPPIRQEEQTSPRAIALQKRLQHLVESKMDLDIQFVRG
jgi:hypothetical protein